MPIAIEGLGHIPVGYDPDEARRLAPVVSADPDELETLQDFQIAAGNNPDKLYGPYTVSALEFYGAFNPPAARVPMGRTEIPPYVPPDECCRRIGPPVPRPGFEPGDGEEEVEVEQAGFGVGGIIEFVTLGAVLSAGIAALRGRGAARRG